MQITMTARHGDFTEAYKEHAEQEIGHLDRYSDHILRTDLIVSQNKYRFTAEQIMDVEGGMLTSKEEADTCAALGQAIQKMERQLKKHNSKLHDYCIKKQAQKPIF